MHFTKSSEPKFGGKQYSRNDLIHNSSLSAVRRRVGDGPERESDTLVAKVGLELGADVDVGRATGRVLHHEVELRHDLDHVARLQNEVAFSLLRIGFTSELLRFSIKAEN